MKAFKVRTVVKASKVMTFISIIEPELKSYLTIIGAFLTLIKATECPGNSSYSSVEASFDA